jgi:hypothetical protein
VPERQLGVRGGHWLLNDDPDPVENLSDDIAHHCRRVISASSTKPPRRPNDGAGVRA